MGIKLGDLLKQAQRRVVRDTFEWEGIRFGVELRLSNKLDLEAMRRKCVRKVREKLPNGGVEWNDKVDQGLLREWMRDAVLNNWSELTMSKVAALCKIELPPDMPESEELPFTTDNVMNMLESAQGFEDWVWTRTLGLANEQDQQATAEKKISVSSAAATSAT